MDDLLGWLGVQLDEDERIARAATLGPWVTADHDDQTGMLEVRTVHEPDIMIGYVADVATADALHIAAHDPARVLREIDAKRDLLRFAEGIHDHHETFTSGVAARLEGTLRLFALAYADRPGYREEWRP